MKGTDPDESDQRKAIMLARGTDTGVVIAVGSPWYDTDYLIAGHTPFTGTFPFEGFDGFDDALLAARQARFEFGETPVASELMARRFSA